VHDKGPRTSDKNWFFAAPKLKKMPYFFWRSTLGVWRNIKVGLVKNEPATRAEVFRQPIFENPLITNMAGNPLGMNDLSEGCAITKYN
jgi:hypothetical protein